MFIIIKSVLVILTTVLALSLAHRAFEQRPRTFKVFDANGNNVTCKEIER